MSYATIKQSGQALVLADSSRLTDLTRGESLSGAELNLALDEAKARIATYQQQADGRALVLWADSSIDWVLTDLACIALDQLLVPAPLFASDAQLQHLITSSGAAFLLTDQPIDLAAPQWQHLKAHSQWRGLQVYALPVPTQQVVVPLGCQKVTFTSGSTGNPKGVCLSVASQLAVAHSLVERIAIKQARHLCLLPLSLLLENIAGVYAPLLSGGEVLLASDADRGFAGSQLVAPQRLLGLISQSRPDTLIMVPELLALLVQAAQQGWPVPDSLKFIAVGGAKVAVALLRAAAALKLPVYQGYGLSECSSVVALSTVSAIAGTAAQLSSVGAVLPHLQVRIVDGEIQVKTPFLGYLGMPAASAEVYQDGYVATGDLGYFDDAGNLVVSGRRKNLLISSFGRNISPEWVEAELCKPMSLPQIPALLQLQQAVLFGDSQPYCVALIYAAPTISDELLAQLVANVNSQLPDYAKVARYHRLTAPLSMADGCLTSNGRPRRQHILQHYQAELAALYQPASPTQSVVPTESLADSQNAAAF